MRQYLTGLDDTPSGAKFAREHYLKAKPDHTVIIGNDRRGYFLDIIEPSCKIARFKPQLRLVVNNV